MPPAEEPHATLHSNLAAQLEVHVGDDPALAVPLPVTR